MAKIPAGQQSDAQPGDSSCVTTNSPRPGSAKKDPAYVSREIGSQADIDHFDAEPGEESVSKDKSGGLQGTPGLEGNVYSVGKAPGSFPKPVRGQSNINESN